MKGLLNLTTAVVILFIGFGSCTKNSESKLTLSSEMDSLSYAIGTEYYANTGMRMHLSNPNFGLLIDTTAISDQYKAQIGETEDDARKSSLQKELRIKIDSANTENQKILNEIARGLSDGNKMNSKLEQAYIRGLSLTQRINDEQMINKYVLAIFGSDEIADKIDRDIFFAGLNASLTNSELMLKNQEEIITKRIEASLNEKKEQDELTREEYADNAVTGKEFLAKNRTESGVVELPNGVQYKIIKKGQGPKPNVADTVTVNFKGTLIDGTVFHSTYEADRKPLIFTLDKILQSWSSVIQLMPVGSKWIIYIPENLAYGSSGVDKIPPMSTLIFETELLNIKSGN